METQHLIADLEHELTRWCQQELLDENRVLLVLVPKETEEAEVVDAL